MKLFPVPYKICSFFIFLPTLNPSQKGVVAIFISSIKACSLSPMIATGISKTAGTVTLSFESSKKYVGQRNGMHI